MLSSKTMIGVLFFCHLIVMTRSTVIFLRNVDCGPYVDYVQTDPLNYFRYNPFYVQLFRCHGADSLVNPRNKQCTPTVKGIKDLEIYVINNSNGTYQSMAVKNHTECIETCSLDKSSCSAYQKFIKDECVCVCQYENTPNPNPCTSPFYWDKSMCDCICSIDTKVCEKRKEFNKEECDCVCKQKFHVRCAKRQKVVDEETCECVEASITEQSSGGSCEGITTEILLLIMALEAFTIIVLYFFLYRYCYKKVYFRIKSDKERESITNYQCQGYSVDNIAHSRSTIDKSRSTMDVEEEVPPYTMNSLNRNSLNRNSLNRNSLNRNSLNRNNIDRIINNNSLYQAKPDEYESNDNIIDKPSDNNFYSKGERSPLNDPPADDMFLYNNVEPTTNYESEQSDPGYYKNISLV